MDICVEGDLIGRLVLELYSHLCPRTARNFLSLCSGEDSSAAPPAASSGGVEGGKGPRLSYVNSLIHRVVPGGWIQGGGGWNSRLADQFMYTTLSIVLDICGGSGGDGVSIFGKVFEGCYPLLTAGQSLVVPTHR